MTMPIPLGTSKHWSANPTGSQLSPRQACRRRHSGSGRCTSLEAKPTSSAKPEPGRGSQSHLGCRDCHSSSPGFAHFFRNSYSSSSPASLSRLPAQLLQLGGGFAQSQVYSIGQSHSASEQTGNVKVILCVQPAASHSSGNANKSTKVALGRDVPTFRSPVHYSLTHCQATTSSKTTPPPPTTPYELRGQSYCHHQQHHNQPQQQQTQLVPSCLTVDARRGLITVTEPTPTPNMRRRASGQFFSKLFAFDAVIAQPQLNMAELCSTALTDALLAVFRGEDGCLLTIGHRHTGKTRSMLGSAESQSTLGLLPCGIGWLFALLNADKERNGTRFSVRVSAVEIMGRDEKFRDLLTNVTSAHGDADDDDVETGADNSPSHYLQLVATPKRSLTESVAQHVVHLVGKQSELRAGSAEKAAHFLDVATRRRSSLEPGLSHMLFTLHIYRCRLEESDTGTNVHGRRTRLHFFDLGCGRYRHQRAASSRTTNNDDIHGPRSQTTNSEPGRQAPGLGTSDASQGPGNLSNCLSLSGIGNVLLALLTGQRHLPFRDSALTYLLREAVTGAQMLQPCILAHVSASALHYTETLQVVKLASKLNRLRRRRVCGNLGVPGIPRAFGRDRQIVGTGEQDEETSSCANTGSTSSTTAGSENTYSPRSHHGRSRSRRGPRLGRLSYGDYRRAPSSTLSYGSEVDFSSSSGEQSCDTVIFAGQWGRSGSGNLPLSRLPEVRGTADGSVDHNDVGRRGSSAEHLPSLPKDDIVNTPQHGNLLPKCMKRMVPRTNVLVWPRSRALRKARHLIASNQETWIDGPNAGPVTAEAVPVSAHYTKAEYPQEAGCQPTQKSLMRPPAPPQPPSYHGYSHNLLTHWDKTESGSPPDFQAGSDVKATSGISSEKEAKLKNLGDAIDLPAINRQDAPTLAAAPAQSRLLPEKRKELAPPAVASQEEAAVDGCPNGPGNSSGDNNSSSSSCSSTLENKHHRGNRALSDISERTEETAAETTMGERGSTDQWPSLDRSHLDITVLHRALELSELPATSGCLVESAEAVRVDRGIQQPVGETRKEIDPPLQKQVLPPTRQQAFTSLTQSPHPSECTMREKSKVQPPEKDQHQLVSSFTNKTDCYTSSCRSTDTFCWLQAQSLSLQAPSKGVLTTFVDRKQNSLVSNRLIFDPATRPSSGTASRIRQDHHHQQQQQQLPKEVHLVGAKTKQLTQSLSNSPEKGRPTSSDLTSNSNPLVRVAAWVNSIHYPEERKKLKEAENEADRRNGVSLPDRSDGLRRASLGGQPALNRVGLAAQMDSISSEYKPERLAYQRIVGDDCCLPTLDGFPWVPTGLGNSVACSIGRCVPSALPVNQANLLESEKILPSSVDSQQLDPSRSISSIYARMRSMSADPFSENVCQTSLLTSFRRPPSSTNDSGLPSPASLSYKLPYRKGDHDNRCFIESGCAEPVILSHPVSPSRPCLISGRADLLHLDPSTPPVTYFADWSCECKSTPQFSKPAVVNSQQVDKTTSGDPNLQVLVATDGENKDKMKAASKGRKFLTLPLFRSLRIKSRGSKKQTKKEKPPVNNHPDAMEESDLSNQVNALFNSVLPYKSPLCRMEKVPPFFCSPVGCTDEPVVLSMGSLRPEVTMFSDRQQQQQQHYWMTETKPNRDTPCAVTTAASSNRMMPHSRNRATTMRPDNCSGSATRGKFASNDQVLHTTQRRLDSPVACYPPQCYGELVPDICTLQGSDACFRCFHSDLPQTVNNLSDSTALGGLLTVTSAGYPLGQQHRTGCRSVTGGPSSSGYESMRIGASDLSLSHSSPSECSAGSSGHPLPDHQLLLRCRGTNEPLGNQRNSFKGNGISQRSGKGDQKQHRHIFGKAKDTGKHKLEGQEVVPVR